MSRFIVFVVFAAWWEVCCCLLMAMMMLLNLTGIHLTSCITSPSSRILNIYTKIFGHLCACSFFISGHLYSLLTVDFWVQIFFLPEKFLTPKPFLTPKKFWPYIFLWAKTFFDLWTSVDLRWKLFRWFSGEFFGFTGKLRQRCVIMKRGKWD